MESQDDPQNESAEIEIIDEDETEGNKLELTGNKITDTYKKLQKRYLDWKDEVVEITSEEKEEEKIYGSNWDQLGYQRTIAGFFYTFGLLIPQVVFGLALIPLLQYTELRFVEVAGMESVAVGLFGALYTILDLDLEETVNRFVPQYAISDPKKAMHYVGFFIKYQMWSGLFQIAFVSSFILFYLIPTNSDFAYAAWLMLFISIKQYPATLSTFHSLLNALQRKNKAELITFYRASLIEQITRLLGGIFGLLYGMHNPEYGEMLGMTLGIFIGGYIDDICFTFPLGMYWLSKVLDQYGIRIRDLYAEKVPKEVWKSALWYSARLMPKTLFGAIMGWSGYVIQVQYTAGYTSYSSLTKRAKDLTDYISWSDDVINKSKAAFSEAYNNNKVELTKFYIANGLKYYTLLIVVLGGVNLLALPVIFDIAIPLFMDETWRPITRMVPIYIALFLYKPFNDIADKMVFLSGHPEVNTIIGILGTIGNLFFTWFFIVHLELGWLGLILFDVPMQLIGFMIRWMYTTRKILHMDKKFWKDISWQVFVAPALSGGVFIGILSILLYIIYPLLKPIFVDMPIFGLEGYGILIPGGIVIIGALLAVMWVYLPLYSYFGGWDDRTLKIFKKSVPLTGPSMWLIYPLYKISKKYHERSPFKDRSFMKLGDIAQEELLELAILRNKHRQDYIDKQNANADSDLDEK